MEPENQIGTVETRRRWQLRWGHILLALFFIVLIAIAYVVVHQIRTADRASQTCLTSNSCSNSIGKNKGGSSKTSAPATTKPSNSTATTSPAPAPATTKSSTPSAANTNSSTNSTTNTTNNSSTTPSSSPTLANTGPGDTIGLFVAVTIAGTALHYFYSKRHLGLTK